MGCITTPISTTHKPTQRSMTPVMSVICVIAKRNFLNVPYDLDDGPDDGPLKVRHVRH